MLRYTLFVCFLLFCLCWPGSIFAQQAHYQPGALYVRLYPQVATPVQLPGWQELAQHYGVVEYHRFGIIKRDALVRTWVVQLQADSLTDSLIAHLQTLPEVELAERRPEYRILSTPNDPQYGSQWHLSKIRASQAYDLATGNPNVVVAVVDNAIYTSHEDLSTQLTGGRDVADNDNNPNPPTPYFDSYSHGTHVAGLVGAATGNATGVASIGNGVSIFPIKAAPNANMSIVSSAIEGVQWATTEGVAVINMSWGDYSYSATDQEVMTAAHDAGILLVAGAGNAGNSNVFYPAGYDHVIAVTSTGTSDLRPTFANYGTWIDICAPGEDILSTLAGSTQDYGTKTGTSMSAPIVSGLLALGKSYRPNATNDQLTNCLYTSAADLDALNTAYAGQLGAGRIDARAFLDCLAALPTARTTAGGVPWQVYPNPATDHFSLQTLQAVQYMLTSPLGQPVLQGSLPAGVHRLQLGHLPRGLYLLQVDNKDGQRSVSRILLQ